MVTILLYLSMLTSGEWLNIDLISIIPIFILTCASMFGLSFIIAGLTIILKQIHAFLQIFQYVLAALTMISVSSSVIQLSLPFTKGIDMIRKLWLKTIS